MSFNRLNRALATLAATALLYATFLLVLLSREQWNTSRPVMAGLPVVNRDSLPAGFAVLDDQPGYDGQYYYRLARTPFTDQRIDAGIVLDAPAYRQQRIFYPLLVRVASLGRVPLMPAAMLAVNFIAICLLGWLGGLYAQALSRHALWGLIFPCYIGFVTSLSRDLTEIVECSLILAALLCLRRLKYPATALLLSLAVLTKEPALLVAVGVGFADLIGDRGRLRRHTWYVAALPVAVYLLRHAWLWHNWQGQRLAAAGGIIGFPLLGFGRAAPGGLMHWHWPWVLALLMTVILAAAVIGSIRLSLVTRWEAWSWGWYALMLFSLGIPVWQDNHAFVRAASEFTLLGSVVLLGSTQGWRNWVLGGGVVCWLGAAVQVSLKP